MKETFVSSSGKPLNFTEEGVGGASGAAGAAVSGAGVKKEQGGSNVKPGKGQGQVKGKVKGKKKARQDGDAADLNLDGHGSSWAEPSSEDESEVLSPTGGMSNRSEEGRSDEDVEEVSPPGEKKRKRKSCRFSPQNITDTLQKISDAKIDRQEEMFLRVAGAFGGGTGAGGTSRGGGGSSSSAPNAEDRRIDLQERQYRVSALQQA